VRKETAVFGGGCFWCLEAAFRLVNGVLEVISGYAGGLTENPTYQKVCSGVTGHAEVVKIAYDADVVSFRDLLKVFFTVHDPTTLNRQGNDVGTQYRSLILTTDRNQVKKAENYIGEIQKDYTVPIVTEVLALDKFWPAEDYHQHYFEKHPDQAYCQFVVKPKVEKVENLLKKNK
jgi:methionine-S-sulfoxide reductase